MSLILINMFKALKMSWPFFKEMIIGRNSFSYALRKNRVRVAFFFAVLLSFCINWVAIPRLFTLSSDYIKLEKELKATKETMASYKDDKEAVDQAKDELTVLRAKVKELENTHVCEKPDNSPVKRDINYVKARLNSVKE